MSKKHSANINEEPKKNKKQEDEQEVADKILPKIKEHFDLCRTHYARIHERMRILDATDRGEMWRALKAKCPKFQIMPDTNFTSYIKSNILSSIYTVAKGASIRPTSETDRDIVTSLNIALEYTWDMADVGYYQYLAGERAALLNLGVTQVGWDDTLTGGSGDALYKGNVTFKNIDPIKFMMDPFAVNFDNAGFCMTYEKYHKSVLLENPLYKDKVKEYFDKKPADSLLQIPEQTIARNPDGDKNYVTLVTYWRKHNGAVEEYHTINCEYLLYYKKNIKPARFPFALLYCNEPAGDLVGTSEPAKAFASSVAYNLLDSIAITAEYKNQRPPKFISANSGLNIQAFTKYGDEADRTFIVSGRADQAVHYHQFPQVTNQVVSLKMGLEQGIQTMTGIDGRYTGRDTGSVITTGGVEDMLNRVTLIDTPKITQYERYTKTLTQLVLCNLLEYSPTRKYYIQEPNKTTWKTVEVKFPEIDSDTLFKYAIDISSELPKNKQRIAATADMLMEKQMQYQNEGSSVQLITEEEWLSMIDVPNKEYMLERMGVQRQQDAVEEVSQVLFQYSDLLAQGANPEDALLATAQGLTDKRNGRLQQPEVPAMIPEEQSDTANLMPQM